MRVVPVVRARRYDKYRDTLDPRLRVRHVRPRDSPVTRTRNYADVA